VPDFENNDMFDWQSTNTQPQSSNQQKAGVWGEGILHPNLNNPARNDVLVIT
jgi:hypothetical protein